MRIVSVVAALFGCASIASFASGPAPENPSAAPAERGARGGERRAEYRALIKAERAGDRQAKGKRRALLNELRQSPGLSAAERCEIVAQDKYLSLRETPAPASFDGRLAAFEAVERSLIAEFPEVRNGYEGLFNIARDASPQRRGIICEDLLRMPGLPDDLRTEVIILQKRQALVGRSLRELAPELNLEPGRETVLYTWASVDGQGGAMLERLRGLSPEPARWVGIYIGEAPPAEETQAKAVWPGELWIERPTPAEKSLSARLLLDRPGMVYIADREGRIRSVNGLYEMREWVSRDLRRKEGGK